MNLQELQQAIVNAHKAGDGKAAQTMIAEYERLKSAPAPAIKPQNTFLDGNASDDNIGQQLYGGFKHAWDSAAMGLKDMLPQSVVQKVDALDKKLGWDGLDENKYQAGKEYVKNTGAASSIGNFLGDAVMYAGGGMGMGALKGAPLLKKIGGALGAATGTGAVAGVTSRGDMDEKLANAGAAAAAQLTGEAALGAASKYLGGFFRNTPVTAEAQKLLDAGIDVPRWKQAPINSPLRAKYEGMRALPSTGSAIKSQERNAMEQWAQSMLNKATPKGESVNLSPSMMDDLAQIYDKGYKNVYKGKVMPDEMFTNKFNKVLDDTANYFPEDYAAVNGIAKKIGDEVLGVDRQPNWGVTFDALKRGMGTADEAIRAAWMKGDAIRAQQYEALKDTLTALRNRSIPSELQGKLGELNDAYKNFKPVQRANSMLGAQTNGFFSPSQLLSAIKAGDRSAGKAAFARQKLPLQKDAILAQQVLGSSIPEVGSGTAEKLIASKSGIIGTLNDQAKKQIYTTEIGQKYLLGELPFQGYFANALRANKYLAPAINANSEE